MFISTLWFILTEKSKLENLQLSLKSETERISTLEKEAEKVNGVIDSTNAANEDMLSGTKAMQLEVESLVAEIENLEQQATENSARLTEISEKIDKSLRTVKNAMKTLQEKGIVERIGGKKSGSWKIKKCINSL